jgi:hypothetical protein
MPNNQKNQQLEGRKVSFFSLRYQYLFSDDPSESAEAQAKAKRARRVSDKPAKTADSRASSSDKPAKTDDVDTTDQLETLQKPKRVTLSKKTGA